jgi:hypothetical protein
MHFLRTVFGVGESHRMFQADVLRWKCFAPHPFWEGGRGYALRYQGAIAAFGCVVPCRFLTGSEAVASCNVIDWAASKAVPGAGLMLYRHIQSLSGTMINIGGTEEARNVLRKTGFQAQAEIQHFTRVVRPWRHFRQAAQMDWKAPLRLARDYRELTRSAQAGGPAPTVRRVRNFDGVTALPDSSITGQVVCARTPESLNYFLGCPATKAEAYLLERENESVGYFLLSRIGNECRIADLWTRSDWTAAYAAATAVGDDVTQITVAASSPLQTRALEQAGFRRTHSEPVFVLDRDGKLHGDLAVSLLENDGFYWSR